MHFEPGKLISAMELQQRTNTVVVDRSRCPAGSKAVLGTLRVEISTQPSRIRSCACAGQWGSKLQHVWCSSLSLPVLFPDGGPVAGEIAVAVAAAVALADTSSISVAVAIAVVVVQQSIISCIGSRSRRSPNSGVGGSGPRTRGRSSVSNNSCSCSCSGLVDVARKCCGGGGGCGGSRSFRPCWTWRSSQYPRNHGWKYPLLTRSPNKASR